MEVIILKKQISILKFEILSTVFVMIVGTLLHFTFSPPHIGLFENPVTGNFGIIKK
jgi:hypothetical protein